MKILVVIPCLYGAEHTREAIDSVVHQNNVDVLLIDNGAERSVKDLINSYMNFPNPLTCISNRVNLYVNPAWQQGIDYFLSCSEYDYLIIMNSDLIMRSDWSENLMARWEAYPNTIYIPQIIQDKEFKHGVNSHDIEVSEGTPGVFITLNRNQAEIINPLPTELKVWFGDNWIYEILRGLGYKTIIPNNVVSYHYWSQNVQKVAGISEIIEEDKRQWELIKHRVSDKIELHRTK
jgi:GT2 family glycosyltransferase